MQKMGCATEMGRIVSEASPHSAPPMSRSRPERHVFDQPEEPQIVRFMNATGG